MAYLEFLAVVAMGGAAWMDWHTRTVPNRYWGWILAAAAPALIIEAVQAPVEALLRWAFALGFAAIMYGLWVGQVFRGGDAKGLMVLAVLLSGVGYYAPQAARIYPAFDALVPALLVADVVRRVMRWRTFPFFAALFPVVIVTIYTGGILWQPIAWFAGLFQ